MALRTRGTDVAWAPCRVLGGAVHAFAENCLSCAASVEFERSHAVLSRKEKAMSHLTWPLLLVLLLLAPASVLAQPGAVSAPGPGVSVSTPAHPALPWALGPATPGGPLIRDIWVPPQQGV